MTRPEEPDGPDDPHGRPTPDGQQGERFDEDAAWRSIVDNFGERAELAEETPPKAPPSEPTTESLRHLFGPAQRRERREQDAADPDGMQTAASWEDEGHFIPPDPPAPPLPPLPRLLAWLGLLGSPAVMLVGVVLALQYPEVISVLLVAWFLGGFGYLVLTMRHGTDDGDDGARL